MGGTYPYTYCGPFAFDGDPRKQDNGACSHDPQVNEEEYLAHFCPSTQPTLNHGIGEWDGTPLTENFIPGTRDDEFLVIHEGFLNQHGHSYLTCDSDYTSYTQPKSIVQGSEGFSPASRIRGGDFSNDAHQHSPVETASNLPVSPALHGISSIPPPIQFREERGSRDGPHRFQKKRKRNNAASRKRPAVMREPLKRPFRCDTCGDRFAQPQGLNRHRRAKHNPSLCILYNFEWSRPYLYRGLLETHHTEVDPDEIIGKTADSRRRAASSAGRPQQQQVLPPTIEHYGRGDSEIRPYPPMLRPPAVVKPATVIPSAMSSMIYIPQSESVQSILAKSSSEEGHPQSTGTTLLWLRSAPLGGYAGHPSNLVTALNPAFMPPVDGHHGSLVMAFGQPDPCTLMHSPLLALMKSGETPLMSRPRTGINSCRQWAGPSPGYHIRHDSAGTDEVV